jgi:hypothetical protein
VGELTDATSLLTATTTFAAVTASCLVAVGIAAASAPGGRRRPVG